MKRIELDTTRILLILLGIIVAVFISFNTSANNKKLQFKISDHSVNVQIELIHHLHNQITKHIHSVLK
jgi:hypothetical protein